MTVTTPSTDPRSHEPVQPPSRLGASIDAVAVSLPRTVVGNAEIAPRIGVTDEWIVRRTGIHSRHIAAPQERLATHAIDAGSLALERAGVAPADVDLVLVATTTPDEVMPNSLPTAWARGARGRSTSARPAAAFSRRWRSAWRRSSPGAAIARS